MQEGKAEGRMGLRRFRRIRERSEDAQAVCLRRDSEAGSGDKYEASELAAGPATREREQIPIPMTAHIPLRLG